MLFRAMPPASPRPGDGRAPLVLLALLAGVAASIGGLTTGRADGRFPRELVDWVPYEGNGLFAGTGASTWDREIRERGFILREADGWKLWYTGYDSSKSEVKSLGYATSPDGIRWTRYPGNPIFDRGWTEDVFVVKHEGIYHMFAEGVNDVAHRLTSPDGLHWEEQGSLDIRAKAGDPIPAGAYGTPTVWVEGGTFHLFYEREDKGIWLATSKDMRVWTNVQDEPVIGLGPDAYDRYAVALNQVIRYRGRYYGVYHANADPKWKGPWTTCLAVSDDLVHWEKYPGNPVIRSDDSSGILVDDGARLRLYTMHPAVKLWLPRGAPPLAAARGGDPWRPLWHFTPPAGWMNDPNGLAQFHGEYHLFYQHHPFGTDWGPMHWGHAVSPDLVRWRHLPIALAPSPGRPDAGGCFSGSAVDDGGVLSLIYTGHGERQVQCLATSPDGRAFTKYPGNPVLASPPDGFPPADFRDPKVWRAEGRWWMVAGSKRDGRGAALLYESEDLRRWSFKGVAAESDGTLGTMWECPDLFALGDRQVLVVSPEGLVRRKALVFVGRLDYRTGRFAIESRHVADHGFDLYAPQSFEDATGRRIVIAWMDSWGSKTWPTKAWGWAGAMTVPRLLRLSPDGTPLWAPVPEIETLRGRPTTVPPGAIEPGLRTIDAVRGDSLDLEVEIDPGSASSVALLVRRSPDGKQETRIAYDRPSATLAIDRDRAGAGDGGVHAAPLSLGAGETLRLRVLVDRSSVEVFAQDGRVVLTDRVYPDPESVGVAVEAKSGRARLASLRAFPLRP
jgi:beta-fructofuranosidase